VPCGKLSCKYRTTNRPKTKGDERELTVQMQQQVFVKALFLLLKQQELPEWQVEPSAKLKDPHM
jgi:hypothetical protein